LEEHSEALERSSKVRIRRGVKLREVEQQRWEAKTRRKTQTIEKTLKN